MSLLRGYWGNRRAGSEASMRLCWLLALLLCAPLARADLYVTIARGLGGTPEYEEKFASQQEQIRAASLSMTEASKVAALSGTALSREALLDHFRALAEAMREEDRAAIYLIGHGSFDGHEYKFNIPGPDLTDGDLDQIMSALPSRNIFLVSTSSASGAMLDALADESRVIATATRNGNERNATEFGAFFAQALSSEAADLNKNNLVSIQEAFDFAQRGVADFFASAGRLATEHPQLRGEGAGQFSLARTRPLETAEDPRIAALLARRQELDAEIEALQGRRNEFSNQEYIQLLQALIIESAQLTEQIELLREGTQP